jgi:hypothetical protein
VKRDGKDSERERQRGVNETMREKKRRRNGRRRWK